MWGLRNRSAGGRHRRPDPPVHVTWCSQEPGGRRTPDSALARSMGQIAALLAHW